MEFWMPFSLHTKDDEIIRELGVHDNEPIHGKWQTESVRAEMRLQAEASEEYTGNIIGAGLAKISTNYAHIIPTRARIAHDLQRHRQRAIGNDQDLDSYRNAISGGEFICVEEPGLIVFASNFNLEEL